MAPGTSSCCALPPPRDPTPAHSQSAFSPGQRPRHAARADEPAVFRRRRLGRHRAHRRRSDPDRPRRAGTRGHRPGRRPRRARPLFLAGLDPLAGGQQRGAARPALPFRRRLPAARGPALRRRLFFHHHVQRAALRPRLAPAQRRALRDRPAGSVGHGLLRTSGRPAAARRMEISLRPRAWLVARRLDAAPRRPFDHRVGQLRRHSAGPVSLFVPPPRH